MFDFFRNFQTAVPPRARIMIFATIAISAVAGYFMYTMVVGEDARKPEESGQVSMNMRPRDDDISKPKPGDEVILPKDSPLAKTVRQVELDKVNNAKKGSGSYIQSLTLNNSQRRSSAGTEKYNEDDGETVESILAKRKSERERKNKTRVTQTGSTTRNAAKVLKNQYLNEFLANEVAVAQGQNTALSAYATQAVAEKKGPGSMSNYTQSGASELGAGSANSGASKPVVASSATGSRDNYARQLLGKGSSSNRVNSGPSAQLANRYDQGSGNTAGISDQNSGLSGSNANDEPKKTHINIGNKYYAVLHESMNTDEPSYITATIVQEGPLKGATFLGLPRRSGESAILEFSSMALNGADYSVSVVAIDPDTGKTRLADDVNRHIVERYTKLGLASFIEGYAEALQETTTNTISGLSQTITSGVLDPGDRVKVAIGNIGAKLSPQFSKEFSMPPTVKVDGGRGIGVMFISGADVPVQ